MFNILEMKLSFKILSEKKMIYSLHHETIIILYGHSRTIERIIYFYFGTY